MTNNGSLKSQIETDRNAAMKAKDAPRLSTLRLLLSAIKQYEVDEQVTLDDNTQQVMAIIDKMIKQCKESIEQYEKAGRQELADQEAFEITVLQTYLPTPLTEDEINQLIEEALTATGATSLKEMGKVMGMLKPKLQGRADIGAVSGLIKQRLS